MTGNLAMMPVLQRASAKVYYIIKGKSDAIWIGKAQLDKENYVSMSEILKFYGTADNFLRLHFWFHKVVHLMVLIMPLNMTISF